MFILVLIFIFNISVGGVVVVIGQINSPVNSHLLQQTRYSRLLFLSIWPHTNFRNPLLG